MSRNQESKLPFYQPRPAVHLGPVELHRRNIPLLRPDDIIIASYPGSGAALIGNILMELNLSYLDPYTEELSREGDSSPAPERLAYRRRLAASDRMDRLPTRQHGGGDGPRFIKTHLYPHEFPHLRGGVVLLIRDPRDAIHSYYHWRLSFSEEGETGNFSQFLGRVGVNGTRPALDWANFQKHWTKHVGASTRAVLLRFEDLKKTPISTVRNFLKVFGIRRPTRCIAAAAYRSSFAQMRGHEDRVAAEDASDQGARVMRRGKVDEWREWYDSTFVTHFSDAVVQATASELGYNIVSDHFSDTGPSASLEQLKTSL